MFRSLSPRLPAMISSLLPGEGRGPGGEGFVTTRTVLAAASPNWASAFAGVESGVRAVLASVGLMALVAGGAASAQDAPAPQAAPAGAPAADDQAGGLVVDVTGGISAPMPIAVPVMPTSAVVSTPAGSTDVLGRQLADIVTNDLRNSGLFTPLAPRAAARDRLSRGHRAGVRLLGQHGCAGAGAGLHPREWRREPDGRLLSVRRVVACRADPAGVRRAAVRLASRGA